MIEQPVVDAGVVSFGSEDTEISTKITNVGNEKLELNELRMSCGCAVGNLTKTQVLPGQSAELLVRLSSKELGERTASAIITSNAENETRLLFRWNVSTNLDSKPSEFFGLKLRRGESVERSFKINAIEPIEFSDLVLENEAATPASDLKVSYELDGRTCKIAWQATKEAVPRLFEGKVVVKHPEKPSFLTVVPWAVRVIDWIEVSPRSVRLDGATKLRLTLKSPNGEEIGTIQLHALFADRVIHVHCKTNQYDNGLRVLEFDPSVCTGAEELQLSATEAGLTLRLPIQKSIESMP